MINKLFFYCLPFFNIATTLTKNLNKKLDKELFQLKENIRVLEDRYETKALQIQIIIFSLHQKKLMEYQQYYFERRILSEKNRKS